MTFNPQTDFVKCPHCAHMLDHWTLDLWQCPSDKTVFDASSFRADGSETDFITIGLTDYDAVHEKACPAGRCEY